MTIHDVEFIRIKVNPDHRGSLSILFSRATAYEAGEMKQWNCIRSSPHVLRGMHAHLLYDELYVPLAGRMFFLLKDARIESPSFGAEMRFHSYSINDTSVLVPAGVAHGVFFEDGGILLYGLSANWTGDHEFSFRWNDSAIRDGWPTRNPILSERDAAAGSFAEMVEAISRAGRARNE